MHWQRWRAHGTTELRTVLHVVECCDCGQPVECAGKKPRKRCAACKARRHREEEAARRTANQSNEAWKATRREQARRHAAKARREHPEATKAACRSWRARNSEAVKAYAAAYSAANRERINARQRRYRRRNAAKLRAWESDYRRMRNALLRGSSNGAILKLEDIAERDGWRCHLCGGAVTRDDWSMDHLIPVSKGGPHVPENVALAHLDCNRRRNARDLADYLAATTAQPG